ncbi:MAG: molybdate ABC transporter substrate-binding protein [Deltaproteobacteria bacterium]|nr:molybdate ABC transporter substrate-binding protein [Deltaproteobacteria bacterium]
MSIRFIKVISIFVIAGVFFVLLSKCVYADKKINAAVVAGFMKPFREIAAAFEKETGIKINVAFTSAGRLYGQIINGAPYDIFLSADQQRPDLLFGKALCSKPFIYAIGEVVLWSSNREFCASGDWREALKQNGTKKIAIANPQTAVYGASAQRALKDTGLWNDIEPRLVTTEDLALVFQYATLGAVDAGFCALAHAYSEEGREGCYCEMKDAPVVIHAACVLKKARNPELADRFGAFLISPTAEKIKKKYGYKHTTGER